AERAPGAAPGASRLCDADRAYHAVRNRQRIIGQSGGARRLSRRRPLVSDDLGGEIGPFLGMTMGLFGFAALLTGRAMAQTWRPGWQIIPVALLLAAADRFLLYALFGATLLSAGGFLIAAAVLALITEASYYRARARKLV